MQVRTGGKASVARVGDVLPEPHFLADVHADRIPVQMGVYGDRAVIVQDFYDVGLIKQRRVERPDEGVVPQVNNGALARGVHGRPIR